MKKILYLLDEPFTTIGGAQKSSKTFIRQAAGMFKCYVLLPNNNQKEENVSGDIEFLYYKKRGNSISIFCRKLWALSKSVKRIRPDYIDAQFSQFGFVLVLYNFIFNKRKKVNCIFTDRDYYDHYNKKYQFIFKRFAPYMYRIVTTTKINSNRWKEKVKGVDTTVIPNVLDESWIPYNQDDEAKFKKDCNPEGKFVVGFCGRYVPYKRWDIAFEIASILNADEEFSFIFILSCRPDDGSDSFLEKIKKLKRTEIIINANESTMSKAYYAMDVFVLTSDNESFGRTLIEAMSRGTVVLGTDTGGVPEVIGREDNLFETGLAQAAVDKIMRLKKNVENYQKNKTYCLERIRENFCIESRTEMIARLYGE